MEFSLTPELISELKKLKTKHPATFAKVNKQLDLFKQNPKHPSLRTHKLVGKLSNSWSISIEGNTRMLYYTEGGEAVFFVIGSHDQVYKR